MYKQDLALNDLQGLMCHENPNLLVMCQIQNFWLDDFLKFFFLLMCISHNFSECICMIIIQI